MCEVLCGCHATRFHVARRAGERIQGGEAIVRSAAETMWRLKRVNLRLGCIRIFLQLSVRATNTARALRLRLASRSLLSLASSREPNLRTRLRRMADAPYAFLRCHMCAQLLTLLTLAARHLPTFAWQCIGRRQSQGNSAPLQAGGHAGAEHSLRRGGSSAAGGFARL